jgi:hypothetical protein
MAVQLNFGTTVRCGDEQVGKLADVVIDPAQRRLTHLVVLTSDEQARLAPVELLGDDSKARKELALTCTAEEFGQLESIREFAFIRVNEFPAPDAETDVGVEDMLTMPSYEAAEFGDYVGELDSSVGLTYDRIPKGEAEIRRSSAIESTDGHHLGHAGGLIVDGGQITHLVLDRGHLWGARHITVPIASVSEVKTDRLTLSLTKDEVGDLPSVRVHRLFG